jgi:hypothetical protein
MVSRQSAIPDRAHSVGVLLQLDLAQARQALLNPEQPGRWRGFQQFFNLFGL